MSSVAKSKSKAPESQPAKKKSSAGRRSHKRKFTGYHTYINRVLKSVHPEAGISNRAMWVMEGVVIYLLDRLGGAVSALLATGRHTTVSSREVQNAVRLRLGGELARHAVARIAKAVTASNAAAPKGGEADSDANHAAQVKKGHSRSVRAGLIFPVGRVGKDLLANVAGGRHVRMGAGAQVAVAAVVEYVVAEILELAGNAGKDLKNARLIPRHILLAVRGDEELDNLFPERGVVLPGGVIPHIHKSLIAKKSKKHADAAA